MNVKQVSLILIALGTLIFILGFLGEIIKFIFQSNVLILAFFAILMGLVLLGYSIFKDNK
jgi:hypothetical protein